MITNKEKISRGKFKKKVKIVNWKMMLKVIKIIRRLISITMRKESLNGMLKAAVKKKIIKMMMKMNKTIKNKIMKMILMAVNMMI